MGELIGVVKVFKMGESLVVTIPREASQRLRIEPGQRLAVKLSENKLAYEVIESGG